jgi:hypothetical protein
MDHLKSNDNTAFTGDLQPHNGKSPRHVKPPGPGEYPGAAASSIGAQFASNRKNELTYSFGLPDNRSKHRTRGDPLERHLKYTSSLPGPGQYKGALVDAIGPQFDSRRPASAQFSFGTGPRDAFSPLKSFPVKGSHSPRARKGDLRPSGGPGSYKPMDGIGVQVLSPRRTASSYSFGPTAGASWKSLRFKKSSDEEKALLPGPGQYKRNDEAFGPQIYTNMRTVPAYGFGTGRRYPRPKTALPGYVSLPGPGQYVLPGSFGEQRISNFRTVSHTRFGKSKRMDVAKASKETPGPNAYDGRIGAFEKSQLAKAAPSFGFGTTRRMRYNAVIMK